MSTSPTSVSNPPRGEYQVRLGRRRITAVLFVGACVAMSLCTVVVLVALLWRIVGVGWEYLSLGFLQNAHSAIDPESSGFFPAIIGTLWLMLITGVVTIPVGIGAAIYLEEYAPDNRLVRMLRLNIANLAGVPSIVYGILGLVFFVRWLAFGPSVLAAGLTLSLLILPVVIIASREALAAVPDSLRQASYALGATRWQTIRHHVLPAALPGIMTGVILALSRAIGEAAPLIMIGALSYITAVPGENLEGGFFTWLDGALYSKFTAMPIQIYTWTDLPDKVYQKLAGSGIVVLLVALLTMNAVAVAIRAWGQRKRSW